MTEDTDKPERERKIERILRQLEKLDQSSRDAELKLQRFTERFFGRVHEVEKQAEEAIPSEANICEIASQLIMNTTTIITSISLEIDSMMRELPQESKTEQSTGDL